MILSLVAAFFIISAIYFSAQNAHLRAQNDLLKAQSLEYLPNTIDTLVTLTHENAKAKGFWNDRSRYSLSDKAASIALIHSEASELLECIRKDYEDDDGYVAQQNNEMEELADIIIRCCDYAGGYRPNTSLGSALVKKMAANRKRHYRHGKRF